MSRTTRLFICLIALLTLFTLLWPGQVEASRLAACLTNITVANANDSGTGSLRQALADVCSGGMVDFAAGLANQTITLTSAELSITKTVTITNPNAANLKVSGNNARRVFNIQTGAVVTISSLSIISGTAMNVCQYNPCGGGIRVNSSARLTINNSTLVGNSAVEGGGIYAGLNSTLIVNSSIFIGNNAADGAGNPGLGGGISAYTGAILIVNNSTFSGNHAGWGAGIFNSQTTIINNSTFSNNSADHAGGGILNDNNGGHSGKLTLNNSTLSNNLSNNYAGGIYNGDVLTITNSTLSDNSSHPQVYSDNLLNSGTLHLLNSILANSNNRDCANDNTIATNINTLIEDGTCSPAFSGDPNLGPLQNNGGSTLTHALLPGSPAIDTGNAATCLSTDQRGITRPLDGNDDNTAVCDIGAFEAPNPSTPTIQFTQAAYTTDEDAGTSQNVFLIHIGILSGASQVQVSLNGGTATAGSDYSSAGFPKTITFGSGVVSQTVPIAIINDTQVEPSETISLTLSPVSNAVIGVINSAVLQIEDNDAAAASFKVYLPTVMK